MLTCHGLAGGLYGQVKFYTQLSQSTVAPRQTFQVQYIIEGTKDIGQFTLPTFSDFRVEEVFDIPLTSTINQKTKEVVDTYSKIVILSPLRTGKFSIPGASAMINGALAHSNAATVIVQQSGLLSSPSYEDIDTEAESELYSGDDIEARIRKNFFIRVEVSKTSCYVGEPIMAVYKVYSRLHTNSQVVRRPSLTGFSVLEMVDGYDGRAEIELYNGVPYYTSIIRKVQLFPLQEGDYVLDAAEIESVVHFVKINRPRPSARDGFRDMFAPKEGSNAGSRTRLNYRTTLRSEPLTISVKPLPATDQPPAFAGAVGNFSLEVQTPASPIRQGDLVKIRMVVNGSGNISLLTAPAIEWPRGVDTADPVVREIINKYVYPATGSKTFEYSFAAPDTGNYVIPAARLPYFDPVQKIYKVATSEPVTLQIVPGERPDLSNIAVAQQGNVPSSRHLYWFALVAGIIIMWISWQAYHLIRSKRAARQPAAVQQTVQPVQAPTPEGLLLKAELALQRQLPEVFYHELEQALWQLIASKYNVLPSSLNKQTVLQVLQEKNVSASVTEDFSQLMQELEWALYTPDQTAHDMTNLYHKAKRVAADILQQQ